MNIRMVIQLLRALGTLRKREQWTREQLTAHQHEAVANLRAYAYAHSPFYQRFHKGLTDRPLTELPMLTKSLLMEHFDELVTDQSIRLTDVEAHLLDVRGDERFRNRYRLNATAGSTGRRGLFLFNDAEWLSILASFARAHEWGGAEISLTHHMKMASVASTSPWHMSARVAATLQSRWMPALRLDASDALGSIVAQLNAWQPEMFVAYASMAHVLAEEQLAGRLHMDPHLIFTSSEVLTAGMRPRIEQAWGKRLFNQYGATEVGDLAAECGHHTGLHLFEDLLLVEVVDEENQPVPVGTYGSKLLVTAFASRTQPLIRYEVSDSIRLSPDPCPCGRPFRLIDSIQGRAEDELSLPTPGGPLATVHPHLFHRVMDTVPGSGWQIVQEDAGLTVLLAGVPAEFPAETVGQALLRELGATGVVVPPIAVKRVAAIPRGAGGKAPLIRAKRSVASAVR